MSADKHDMGTDASKNNTTACEVVRIQFHEDMLDVARLPDGDVGVSLRRMCEVMGLDADAQRKRLDRAAATGAVWATTVVMTAVAEDGKTRDMLFLPRASIPMWAATIDARRVREDVRAKVVRYQNEAADALDRYFNKGAAFNPRATDEHVLRLVEEHIGPRLAAKADATTLAEVVENSKAIAEDMLMIRTGLDDYKLKHACAEHKGDACGEQIASMIKCGLRRYADLMAPPNLVGRDLVNARRSLRMEAELELRQATGHAMFKTRGWETLPSRAALAALLALKSMLERAGKQARRMGKDEQAEFDFGAFLPTRPRRKPKPAKASGKPN